MCGFVRACMRMITCDRRAHPYVHTHTHEGGRHRHLHVSGAAAAAAAVQPPPPPPPHLLLAHLPQHGLHLRLFAPTEAWGVYSLSGERHYDPGVGTYTHIHPRHESSIRTQKLSRWALHTQNQQISLVRHLHDSPQCCGVFLGPAFGDLVDKELWKGRSPVRTTHHTD